MVHARVSSQRASYADAVTMIVHLPEELARQLAAVAAARRQTPEQVALDAIETAVHAAPGATAEPPVGPGRRRLLFAGIGSSGPPGRTTARDHRQLRVDTFVGKTARDV